MVLLQNATVLGVVNFIYEFKKPVWPILEKYVAHLANKIVLEMFIKLTLCERLAKNKAKSICKEKLAVKEKKKIRIRKKDQCIQRHARLT